MTSFYIPDSTWHDKVQTNMQSQANCYATEYSAFGPALPAFDSFSSTRRYLDGDLDLGDAAALACCEWIMLLSASKKQKNTAEFMPLLAALGPTPTKKL